MKTKSLLVVVAMLLIACQPKKATDRGLYANTVDISGLLK